MDTAKTIYILSGAIIKNNDGSWRTTFYHEKGDKLGALGDRMRIVAGAYLFKNFSDVDIIVSGGKGGYSHHLSSPNVSKIMKKELVRLAVAKERIFEHPHANTTYEQLLDALNLLENKYTSMSILSNRYHIPR